MLLDKYEILNPLREVRKSLNENKGQHIANSDLLDLIRRVRCFGISLARLDIRQAPRHEKFISEIFKSKNRINYTSLSEKDKIKLLSNSNKPKKIFLEKIIIKNKENKEVWKTFKEISNQPQQCMGAYVISMTSKASDILSVYFLQKQSQIKNLLRVVPLFETLDDLKMQKMLWKIYSKFHHTKN